MSDKTGIEWTDATCPTGTAAVVLLALLIVLTAAAVLIWEALT